jgi:cytochrome c biogenesis protein CcdA
MFSRWIVTNITSASVTTFLAFLAGIISWSVYCICPLHPNAFLAFSGTVLSYGNETVMHTRRHNDVYTSPLCVYFAVLLLMQKLNNIFFSV